MAIDYSKWNAYKIGSVPWINSRRDHPCREYYLKWVREKQPESILEIGPGECIEAVNIIKLMPEVRYEVLDVSDTFLEHANRVGIKSHKGEMHNTGLQDKSFDLVYISSVIEHTPDITATVKELARISDRFYITMFKWRFGEGDLQSVYIKKRHFYSTAFNLAEVLCLIERYGKIDNTMISLHRGGAMPLHAYRQYCTNGMHRTGNYLSIIGRWK